MGTTEFDVVVVGAGFAGMYTLHRLRKLGLSTRVVEAGDGVGGTWYWNRYPGARCDIESMQYSYQFDAALAQEWNWSEKYSPQPEILSYAEHVAERFELKSDIDFNARINQATFDDESATWRLESEDGRAWTARYVIFATGCLSVPNWPKVEGFDEFKGECYHTAKWPHEPVSFKGKRVAIIGTGSSAIQSLPIIAADAAHVTVFQRTPNYSIPARNQPMDADYADSIKHEYPAMRARAKTTFPGIDGPFNAESALGVSERERLEEYEARWQAGGLTFMGAYGDLMLDADANASLANFVRDKIRSTVKNPGTAELLCPMNIIGGKRLCVDTDYYETYNLSHVELVDVRTAPVERIVADGVQVDERVYEADMIVIATGFDAMTGALTSIDIKGLANASLRELWRDGPSTYLGLAMADFPNLFTVTGPGSPSVFTNMLPTIEQHVEWITDCIGHLVSHSYTRIEADAEAQAKWWEHVQDVAKVGLKSTTDSWYVGANVAGKARVFLPYFGGFPAYCAKCEEVSSKGYEGFTLS